MNHRYARLAIGVAAGCSLSLALAGCGLISSDVTNFDLTLPDKKFSIDTAGWQIDQSKADVFTSQSCSSNAMVCSSAVQQACPMGGCSGSCNAAKTCDLSLDVSVVQKVDLVTEKPELKSINDEPVIKVTIDSVTYDVIANTLNVDTPPITIYVAPISVVKVDPKDPQVKAIGTIAPVPAGTTTAASGPKSIQFTTTGKADLVNIMSTFKTPFNILVGSSLLVTAGQPVPMGKLDAVVHIKGHAGL
jgi:hypothetical protein